eukprot:4426908-Amphidinium_carterae.1
MEERPPQHWTLQSDVCVSMSIGRQSPRKEQQLDCSIVLRCCACYGYCMEFSGIADGALVKPSAHVAFVTRFDEDSRYTPHFIHPSVYSCESCLVTVAMSPAVMHALRELVVPHKINTSGERLDWFKRTSRSH